MNSLDGATFFLEDDLNKFRFHVENEMIVTVAEFGEDVGKYLRSCTL